MLPSVFLGSSPFLDCFPSIDDKILLLSQDASADNDKVPSDSFQGSSYATHVYTPISPRRDPVHIVSDIIISSPDSANNIRDHRPIFSPDVSGRNDTEKLIPFRDSPNNGQPVVV